MSGAGQEQAKGGKESKDILHGGWYYRADVVLVP